MSCILFGFEGDEFDLEIDHSRFGFGLENFLHQMAEDGLPDDDYGRSCVDDFSSASVVEDFRLHEVPHGFVHHLGGEGFELRAGKIVLGFEVHGVSW